MAIDWGWFSLLSLGWAVLIFLLRLVNIVFDTLRMLAVARGRKWASWAYGFLQVLLFLLIFSWVFSDLSNPVKVIGYCAGFATGNWLGMILEEKIGFGYTYLRIISTARGEELTDKLRSEGYGVTEMAGHGRDGTVSVLNCSVLRKKVQAVTHLVQQIDPSAFITAQEVRAIQRGFWGLE